MSAPTKYGRDYSFTGYQASNPADPLPGDRVDIELDNVAQSLSETIDALTDFQDQVDAAAASAVAADASADAAAASAASIALPIPIDSGGTGQTTASLALAALGGIGAALLTTRGDIITRSATAPQRLALGTSGRVLQSDGTDAIYGTLTAGAFASGPGIVTPAMLDNGTALSVLGRSANSAGARADITAANDGEVMRRSGTAIGFGTVATAGIADDAATNAKLANMAQNTIKGRVTASTGDPEDLSAANVSTILGLGTMATQAASTVAITGGTIAGISSLALTGAGLTPFSMTSTDAGASNGPEFIAIRDSASPAAADRMFRLQAQGRDSGGNITSYLTLAAQIEDPTDGSEDAVWIVQAMTAGSLSTQATIGNGVLLGTATGGAKGTGTINCTAAYDDNVLLTCYVLEAERTGRVDLDQWDGRVANRVIPAVVEKVFTKAEIREEVRDAKGNLVLQPDGTFERLVAPAEFEMVEREPEQVIERAHEPARAFAEARMDELDPAVFTAKWRVSGVLPGMPTPEQWAADGPQSTGQMVQKLWELCEIQAVHIGRLTDRLIALEARVP